MEDAGMVGKAKEILRILDQTGLGKYGKVAILGMAEMMVAERGREWNADKHRSDGAGVRPVQGSGQIGQQVGQGGQPRVFNRGDREVGSEEGGNSGTGSGTLTNRTVEQRVDGPAKPAKQSVDPSRDPYATEVGAIQPNGAGVEGLPERPQNDPGRVMVKAGVNVSCVACGEVVYRTTKPLLGTMKLSDLKDSLVSVGGSTPITATTEYMTGNGVAMNCPKCNGVWSVVIC